MTSKQLALPERLPERGGSGPAGEIGLMIDAEYLELTVEAVPGLARATAELNGPQDVLDRIQETREDGVWSLTWPRDGRRHGGGTTVIQTGGSQTISFGRSGRMTVNGVDITSLINGAGGEPLTARFRVPAKSGLIAKVDSGGIRTSGILAGVRATTVSADVTCDGPVGQLQATSKSGDITAEQDTGPVTASSVSGDVEVTAARGVVTAQTVSGDVKVHALESVLVSGTSVSGNVSITAAAGARPIASGNSVSGSVRLPR
jgi:Putative adhesin